jgi:hypothetical protein
MPGIMPYLHACYEWTVTGQPIPAPRLTQASARNPTIPKGYYAFKHAVRSALLDQYPSESFFVANIVGHGWPFCFPQGAKGELAILEFWLHMACAKTGNCRHGDPDNICKAISDALFADDRHVLPRCMGLACGSNHPRCTIRVTLNRSL